MFVNVAAPVVYVCVVLVNCNLDFSIISKLMNLKMVVITIIHTKQFEPQRGTHTHTRTHTHTHTHTHTKQSKAKQRKAKQSKAK